MSALTRRTDIGERQRQIRKVPEVDVRHLYLARAYGSGTPTRGSSARTEVWNCAGSTCLRCAHSTRFAGRYVGSARHRLNTLASIVSLILMWLSSFRGSGSPPVV